MKRWLGGVCLIFLIFAFQVANIPNMHMHPDEELSYRATRDGLDHVFYYQQSGQDNQAPLWFISFWAWQQIVGDAEFTSRVMGALTSVLTLAITYRLGRRWFGNAAALAALAILGANHFFFTYTLDIRPYPLVIFSAALSIWMFERWRHTPDKRRTLFYGLSVALLLYVHYLLTFLVVVQVVFVLLFQPNRRRLLVSGAAAMVLGFLIWLPWFPTFVDQVITLRNVETASGTARGAAGIGVSTLVTSLPTIVQLAQTATNGMIWLYAIVLLVGVWMMWRKPSFWLAVFWGIGVPVVALVANLFFAVYAHRFVSHATVGLALALGAVLLAKPNRLYISAAAVFVALNLFMFPTQFPVRIPYRDLYADVSAQVREGDALLNLGSVDGFVQWQIDHYLSPVLVRNTVSDVASAQSFRRVWFLTDDWLNDPAQRDFAVLEPSHPVQTVFGQCNRAWCYIAQLMEAPPWTEPMTFGDHLAFWGADVDSVTDTEIRTRLWWRVAEPPPVDYSIGLQLLNSDGALVAQNDGPIHHYAVETVQTSSLQPERIYIDFRSVALPPELPAGEYRLTLVVYQSWDGVRLTLPDGSDHLVLDTIRLD